jgi:Cu/Ag efflux protein CusF
MKKALLLTLTLSVALSPLAHAEGMPQPQGASVVATAPGKGIMARTLEVRAKVLEVDLPNRVVTVEGPHKKVQTITIGEEVRNLPQVKPGDHVVVRYVEALSLELKKNGSGIRERTDSEDAVRAAPGEKPAGIAGRKVRVVADVVAIDQKKQLVTLRGPQRTLDLHVADPQQLKLVKKGDQVEAIYTEALAMSVEVASPMAAKK